RALLGGVVSSRRRGAAALRRQSTHRLPASEDDGRHLARAHRVTNAPPGRNVPLAHCRHAVPGVGMLPRCTSFTTQPPLLVRTRSTGNTTVQPPCRCSSTRKLFKLSCPGTARGPSITR